MSDLVVTAFTPVVGTGQGLRTYGVVKALAGLGPVDLLYANFGADEPAPEFAAIDDLSLLAVQPTRRLRRLLSYGRALAAGVPDGFARGSSPELVAKAEELASAPGRGRVIADGPVAGGALRDLADRHALIYNAHNLESSFRHQVGPSSRTRQRRLERFEARLIGAAAETWMASRADEAAARRLVPEARIRYVPNVVDTTRIEPASDPGSGIVLFVGDFRYPPNLEALTHLEAELLPALWELVPDARVEVVGRGLDGRTPPDPRIAYLGFVPDLGAAYAAAACVAIPLLTGGGSPLKFVEALAYGSAVVATPIAAQGVDAVAGRDYLEASEPREFAESVAAVLRDGRPELRRNARQLAETAYSIEALRERLTAP